MTAQVVVMNDQVIIQLIAGTRCGVLLDHRFSQNPCDDCIVYIGNQIRDIEGLTPEIILAHAQCNFRVEMPDALGLRHSLDILTEIAPLLKKNYMESLL